jgi:polyhydroxybutyrate depolymerase
LREFVIGKPQLAEVGQLRSPSKLPTGLFLHQDLGRQGEFPPPLGDRSEDIVLGWRIVGPVDLVGVDEEEEDLVTMVLDPLRGAPEGLIRPAGRRTANLARELHVVRNTARETALGKEVAILGHRRSAVAGLRKSLRKGRERSRQPASPRLDNAMGRGIDPGHQAQMRGPGRRKGRPRLFEQSPLGRQGVEDRARSPFVSIGTQDIGPQGVERDDDEIPWIIRCGDQYLGIGPHRKSEGFAPRSWVGNGPGSVHHLDGLSCVRGQIHPMGGPSEPSLWTGLQMRLGENLLAHRRAHPELHAGRSPTRGGKPPSEHQGCGVGYLQLRHHLSYPRRERVPVGLDLQREAAPGFGQGRPKIDRLLAGGDDPLHHMRALWTLFARATVMSNVGNQNPPACAQGVGSLDRGAKEPIVRDREIGDDYPVRHRAVESRPDLVPDSTGRASRPERVEQVGLYPQPLGQSRRDTEEQANGEEKRALSLPPRATHPNLLPVWFLSVNPRWWVRSLPGIRLCWRDFDQTRYAPPSGTETGTCLRSNSISTNTRPFLPMTFLRIALIALALATTPPAPAEGSVCATLRIKATHGFATCLWAAEKKAARSGSAAPDTGRCTERLTKLFGRVASICGVSNSSPDQASIATPLEELGRSLGTALRTGEALDASALCGTGLSWSGATRRCEVSGSGITSGASEAPDPKCAMAGIKAVHGFSSCLFGAEKKAARKSIAPDTSACPARLNKFMLRAQLTCGASGPALSQVEIGESVGRISRALSHAARVGQAPDLGAFCGSGTQWDETTARCETDGGTSSLPTGLSTFYVDQEVEGVVEQRRFLVAAPASFEPGRAYPLLFAFHGNGGSGDGFVSTFSSWVSAGDFIGVYPDGMSNSWNLGPEASAADDVAFVESIVAELGGYPEADTDRLIAFGSSNGAGLVHLLAIETDLFDGVAAFVTSLLENNQPPAASHRVGVLQVLGTEDSLVPYTGGVGVLGHEFMDAEESARTWAEANSCTVPGTTTTTAGGNIKIAYSGCTDGVDVVHYGIVGAGHGLPPSAEGGLTSLAVNFLMSQPD